MRTQTVLRTVRGALSYHDALAKRLQCFQMKGKEETEVNLKV